MLVITSGTQCQVWIRLGPPITAMENTLCTSDLIGTDQQRYYRVKVGP
jgi:hypothetical protein